MLSALYHRAGLLAARSGVPDQPVEPELGGWSVPSDGTGIHHGPSNAQGRCVITAHGERGDPERGDARNDSAVLELPGGELKPSDPRNRAIGHTRWTAPDLPG